MLFAKIKIYEYDKCRVHVKFISFFFPKSTGFNHNCPSINAMRSSSSLLVVFLLLNSVLLGSLSPNSISLNIFSMSELRFLLPAFRRSKIVCGVSFNSLLFADVFPAFPSTENSSLL